MAGHVPPQCHTRRLLTGAIPGPAQERSPGQEEPCQPLFPSGASSQVTRCGACLAGSWLLGRRGLELCPRSSRLGGSRARGPSSRQAEQTPHPRRLARPPPKRRVPPGSSPRLALLPPDEDVPHFQLSAPRRCHPNARPPNPQTVTHGMKQPFPLTTSLKSPAQRGPFLNVQTILVLPTHLTPSLHWTWATPEGRNPFASVAPHPDHRMQPRHGPERMDGARPDPHDAPVPRGPLSPPPSCSGLSSQGSSAARDPGQASQPSLGCDCLPSCFTGSKSPRDDRGGRGVLPWSCAGPDLWAVAGRAEETARQGTSPPPVTFMTHGP